MQRISLYKILFLTTIVTFAVVIAALIIHHKGPHYEGRSISDWFDIQDTEAKYAAFRVMGLKSFPFIIEKLNGSIPDRIKACMVVENAFNGSQIENSEIKAELMHMLESGEEGEELPAYEAINHLGVNIPDSIIMEAAHSCPAIQSEVEETVYRSKIARLFNMVNSPDCAYIAQLCNDSNSRIQMTTLDFLIKSGHAKNKSDICDQQIVPALAYLMKNTSDPSVLSLSLVYMGETPTLIRENLATICNFLETTTNSTLQMDCLAAFAGRFQYGSLPLKAQRSIELLCSRQVLNPKIRRQADALLDRDQ